MHRGPGGPGASAPDCRSFNVSGPALGRAMEQRMGHILVIAPNPDLRQSLRFALEAEGHEVTACQDIDEAQAAPGPHDCTVLDHHAADRYAGPHPFSAAFGPVVLLVNSAGHPLAGGAALTLTKPSLGPFLSQAVGEAIRLRHAPT